MIHVRWLWGSLGVLLAVALAGAQAAQAGAGLQVGDRIVLRVVGEPQLTDTFTVSAGPALVLPVVGAVPLIGVSRGGVERVLSAAIAKYFRNPVVSAHTLVRIGVLGEVFRPGFYSVRSDMLIPDILMAAGGPTQAARVGGTYVVRGGTELISADSTAKAITSGRTLSQLGIVPEDQFIVPRNRDPQRTLQIVTTVISLSVAVVTVLLLRR